MKYLAMRKQVLRYQEVPPNSMRLGGDSIGKHRGK